LPSEIQAIPSARTEHAEDIHTHYEDVPSFVHRAKETIAGIIKTSNTTARGFDIEIRLVGEIGDWREMMMHQFLVELDHASGDLVFVVYGENVLDGDPDVYVPFVNTANAWWSLWSALKMPWLKLVDLP